MNITQHRDVRTGYPLRTPKPIKKMSIDLSQMYAQEDMTSSGSLEQKILSSPAPLKLRTRRSVHCFESEEAMNDLQKELMLVETRSCNPIPKDIRFQSMDVGEYHIDQEILQDLF